MTKKVCDHSVSVVRDGKSVTVKPGEAFDFSDEEIADIERHQPDSLRDPRNEDPESAVAEVAKKSGKGGKSKGDDL